MDSWGRVPMFEIGDLTGEQEIQIEAVYIDVDTDEFVIVYYIE